MDRNPENPMISVDEIVALRKESVDRNISLKISVLMCILSLSARRAWIEIFEMPAGTCRSSSRSPQGERG